MCTMWCGSQIWLIWSFSKQLALTHLSPRYVAGNPLTPDDLLAEARTIFPATVMAKDFLTLEVGGA